jgi:biotin carboxylase
VAGVVSFRPSDAAISVADTGIPNGKVITTMSNTGISTASATIAITMYAVADEQASVYRSTSQCIIVQPRPSKQLMLKMTDRQARW